MPAPTCLMGQCTSKMTCHGIDIEMLAFLLQEMNPKAASQVAGHDDSASFRYHLHCNTLWMHVVSHHWNSFFQHFSRSFLTRGLNKGKASGCKTSSKYQYNDCHLQGTFPTKSSWKEKSQDSNKHSPWIPCIPKTTMAYDIHFSLPKFGGTIIWQKSMVNCKTQKRTKLRRGDPQGLLPSFLSFCCTCRKLQRASLNTVLCASNMAPARHDQEKPGRPLL